MFFGSEFTNVESDILQHVLPKGKAYKFYKAQLLCVRFQWMLTSSLSLVPWKNELRKIKAQLPLSSSLLSLVFVTGAPLGPLNSCCHGNQGLLSTILEQVRANTETLAKNAATLARNEAQIASIKTILSASSKTTPKNDVRRLYITKDKCIMVDVRVHHFVMVWCLRMFSKCKLLQRDGVYSLPLPCVYCSDCRGVTIVTCLCQNRVCIVYSDRRY